MKRILSFLIFLTLSSPAGAEPAQSRERSFGADRFVAGPAVSIAAPVAGDLFAAGGNIDVDAAVGGDAVIAGGNVRLGASVGQDLYLGGGRVSVNAAVQRNARIAGGNVEIGPRAKIAGNASVAGGDIRIAGAIGGYLQVGGGHVFLDAPVGGDVDVGGGTIELGPGARIGGKLRYASPDELKQDAGAQVVGGIERRTLPQAARPAPAARERAARGIHWVWSAGMIVLAAILGAALPNIFTGTASILRTRWAWSLLAGFIALVCIPAAALIAMITIVGIPLALAAMALYFALLLIGYATTGVSLGLLGLQRWQPARSSHGGFRLLYAALGMLVVCLLASMPWIGGFIVLAAMLIGIGALLLRLKPGTAT